MNLIDFINEIWQNLVLIGRAKKFSKAQLSCAYAKITLKFLFGKLLGIRIRSEKVLGYKIAFPGYGMFRFLFTEMFIGQGYYFPASRNPVIIDCGSNIGMSVLYFKKLYPEAEITAIEPNPGTFDILMKNIEANHLKSVTCINAAVFNKNGHMWLHTDHSGDVSASLKYGGKANKVKVKVIKLSTLISRKVDLLKLDVEGVEFLVLEEIKSKLKQVQRLAIEFHPDDEKDKLRKIFRILRAAQFTYEIIDSAGNLIDSKRIKGAALIIARK